MKTAKLGDICKIVNGGTPKTGIAEYWDGDILWITPKDLGKVKTRETSYTSRKITRNAIDNSSAKVIPANSVILSTRAPIGHVVINTEPMAFNQGCRGLIPGNDISAEYLYFFLKLSKSLLNELGTGTTFRELSTGALSKVELPLHSLSEQRKIVARLDAAFEKISAAEVLMRRNLDNVAALQKSILHKYLSASDSTHTYRLGDVGIIQTGTTPKTSEKSYYGGSTMFIKPSDFLKDGHIRTSGQKLSDAGVAVGRLIGKNSVLMVCIGATIGKVGYTDISLSCNQQINAITLNSLVEAKYLYYVMTSDEFQAKIKKNANQMTLPIINKTTWSNLTIDLPDLKTQKDTVATLDNAFIEIRKLEAQYLKKLSKFTDLRQSLLRQAFSTTNTV